MWCLDTATLHPIDCVAIVLVLAFGALDQLLVRLLSCVPELDSLAEARQACCVSCIFPVTLSRLIFPRYPEPPFSFSFLPTLGTSPPSLLLPVSSSCGEDPFSPLCVMHILMVTLLFVDSQR